MRVRGARSAPSCHVPSTTTFAAMISDKARDVVCARLGRDPGVVATRGLGRQCRHARGVTRWRAGGGGGERHIVAVVGPHETEGCIDAEGERGVGAVVVPWKHGSRVARGRRCARVWGGGAGVTSATSPRPPGRRLPPWQPPLAPGAGGSEGAGRAHSPRWRVLAGAARSAGAAASTSRARGEREAIMAGVVVVERGKGGGERRRRGSRQRAQVLEGEQLFDGACDCPPPHAHALSLSLA